MTVGVIIIIIISQKFANIGSNNTSREFVESYCLNRPLTECKTEIRLIVYDSLKYEKNKYTRALFNIHNKYLIVLQRVLLYISVHITIYTRYEYDFYNFYS